MSETKITTAAATAIVPHRCDRCGRVFDHEPGPQPCPMGSNGEIPEAGRYGLCGGVGAETETEKLKAISLADFG